MGTNTLGKKTDVLEDSSRFPLEGKEWDEFWYGNRLVDCRTEFERQFFSSQELVRNEVIQRLPEDQLAALDPLRLSDYGRVAVARRWELAGCREDALRLIETVLTASLDHPLLDYAVLFREAIDAARARGSFAAAIALQREYVAYVTVNQGAEAARPLAGDLAQLMVESGDATRGAFVFQETFKVDPAQLAEANRRAIADLGPELLTDTARSIRETLADARADGDEETLKLYRDLMGG